MIRSIIIAAALVALSNVAAAGSMADVQAADAAIAAAKEQRKQAIKGLSKIERAQLRVQQAERGLAKAQADASKPTKVASK